MRAQHEEAEFNVRSSGELAKRPVEVAVVGTRCGNDADATATGWTHDATVWFTSRSIKRWIFDETEVRRMQTEPEVHCLEYT